MNDLGFLVLTGTTYLLIGAWVIRLTSGSRVGVPVKAQRTVEKLK